ncbi:hypothetical protein [Natronorubrum bangense]|uniref:Uncharacterized protein n=2 Tax=Natronorubrum bangense TaxID=61858 RepID=L9W464_9EURY|nr:hypothetical protein [Natronorubrum bangense]ELY44117.1 hypothetical protein C494_17023 [Natronorubrum bangense JCM 10635]QCC55616.1 hypothetical protein DV706_14765 [Natronorubrum bangense]
MASDKILIGILGLQIAVIAGTVAIIQELAPAAEGTMVMLMWGSILITLSGFLIGRVDNFFE